LPDDPPWATPLAWATRRGHTEIVRILTEYEQTGALPSHHLEEYEAVALDFVEAYKSGDASAMRRIWDHFQVKRIPSQEEFREQVQKRLGAQAHSENANDEISLADAQFLVARLLGFENWEQLAKHTLEN
jgi:predicted patatin/cPLA2 family phospholipase